MSARHYPTMDGLRGVAAIAVVFHHYSTGISGVSALSQGYLAVDLFFLMSGFVLEHAYGGKLAGGMGLLDFMRIRTIRIYPMLVLGWGIALAAALALPGATLSGRFAVISALNLAGLPYPVETPLGYGSWPLNPPTWSIFYELLGSVIFGAWVWRSSTRRLVIMVAVSFAALSAICFYHSNLDFGPRLAHGPGTIARFLFSFALGCLLFRVHRRWAYRLPRPMIYAAAMAALLVPAAKMPLFDLLCVSLLFPAVVLASTQSGSGGAGTSVEAWLGRISYPLYILHWPLMAVAGAIGKRVGGDILGSVPGVLVLASVAVAAAWLAVAVYDEPVRRWLTRRRPLSGAIGAGTAWARQTT